MEIPQPAVDPAALAKLLEALPVTGLKVYAACPYRFYLRYLAKLERIDDASRELDALSFGNVLHEVLEQFGQSELAASLDGGAIEQYLTTQLDLAMRQRFGGQPATAVRAQHEQARQRLAQFASWQAHQAREGWRIQRTMIEEGITLPLGEGVIVSGRIDRVDRLGDTDVWRVLDYKTGETPADPQKDHLVKRDGVPTWVNFQLPLYITMLRDVGGCGQVQAGYVALSKKPGDDLLNLAKWDEDQLAEARGEAERLGQQIRQGVFWPPRASWDRMDEFSALTLEGVWGRERALRGAGDA